VETTRLLLNASASSLEDKYALPTQDDGYKYSLNVAVKTGRHDTFTELYKLQRYTVDRYSSRILSTFRFVVTARPEFKESIDEGIDVEVVGGGPGFEVRGIQEYENMRDRVTGRCHPRGRRTVRDIYADEWGPILPDVIEGFEEDEERRFENEYIDIREEGPVLEGRRVFMFCYVLAENWAGLINEERLEDVVGPTGVYMKGYVKSVLDGAEVGSWIVVGDSINGLYERIIMQGGNDWKWDKVGKWILGHRSPTK